MKRILMMLGFGALLFHVSCKSEHHEKQEEVKFLVTNPIQKDTLITKDYVSQIQSSRHIELRAQERGYLQKIYVDEGAFVKEGQLLFQILPGMSHSAYPPNFARHNPRRDLPKLT